MSEINRFLNPISEEHPSGQDMVFSIEFDTIQKARQEDDPNLEQGDWITDLKEADWSLVVKTAESLLLEKTKDIRVAGWLLEGWIRQDGFAGYARGLELLDGLCRTFWDTLNPQIEDGDVQQQAGNFAWIINRSRNLIGRIPLTLADGARYGYIYWDAANQLAHAVKRSPDEASSLTRGKVTHEIFDEARKKTPPDFYIGLHEQVLYCQAIQQRFSETLTNYLADEAPSFSQIHQQLEDIESLVQRLGSESGVILKGAKAKTKTEDVQTMTVSSEPAIEAAHHLDQSVLTQIKSRSQALEQLRQIAVFFRETEPHSPVAYLAEKAVLWANLPLHAWLKAVVKNADALTSLEELLGVEVEQRSSDE